MDAIGIARERPGSMVEQMRHEETTSPRERIDRLRRLLRRGLKFWKGSVVILLVAVAAAFVATRFVKHVYRSECTIFAKSRMRTDDRDDSGTSPEAIARQAARLKDMVTTRARLETAIKEFHLYPETTANKTMLDAVEQMKPHVGFRSLEGGQYVISFDGDAPDQVKDVTQYLSESLIDEYAAGDLLDLKHEADFLAGEEERSLSGLEEATKALTIFLADHPEFALEAKQAATTPFGPSPTAGIPLMPKVGKVDKLGPAPTDGELAVLFRERARLEGEVHGTSGASRGVPAATPSSKQLDDQIAQAQGEVEAAAKRVAETQGDLASKSNLTEDHPDMRAARMAASAAARQLHEAKVQLAALQQMKASGAGPSGDSLAIPQEIADKLRQVDAQIIARRGQLAKGAQGAPATSASGQARNGSSPTSPMVTAVVVLETDWQRLLRGLGEAKSYHDDLKARAERAKLALGAARAQANERMAIIDPPYRPTHPSKGGRANVAVAGVGLALLLAVAYATARLTLDDTLVDADDVEALGVVPMIGVVPEPRSRSS